MPFSSSLYFGYKIRFYNQGDNIFKLLYFLLISSEMAVQKSLTRGAVIDSSRKNAEFLFFSCTNFDFYHWSFVTERSFFWRRSTTLDKINWLYLMHDTTIYFTKFKFLYISFTYTARARWQRQQFAQNWSIWSSNIWSKHTRQASHYSLFSSFPCWTLTSRRSTFLSRFLIWH